MGEHVGPYILGKTLGVGTSGKVKLAVHKETGEKVAIKILPKINFLNNPDLKQKVGREIAVLKLMKNPHILRIIDVYETSRYLFIVLELMEEGELFDYLVNKGRITHEEALCLFQQIIYGLEYCHNHLICHRDLKPENLLVDKKQNIKIADFGMARLINTGSLASTSCGSPHYASPEVVRGIPYDGMASDVWSCGVILYALLIGRLPFDDNNLTKVLQKVEKGVYIMPNTLSQPKVDLIQRMLTVDPKQRITIPEIKKHPWFRSNFPDGYLPPSISSIKNKTNKPIILQDIPKEILSYLKSLGWEETQLENSLKNEEPNIEKVFYHLFEKRIYNKQKKKERPRRGSLPSQPVNIQQIRPRGFSLHNSKSKQHTKKNSEQMLLDDERSDENQLFDNSQEMFSMDVENRGNHQNSFENPFENPFEDTFGNEIGNEIENDENKYNENYSTTHLEKRITPQKQPIPESPIGPSFSRSPKKSWFARIFGKNKEKSKSKNKDKSKKEKTRKQEKKRIMIEDDQEDKKKPKTKKTISISNIQTTHSDLYQKTPLNANSQNTYQIVKKTSKLPKIEIASNLQKTLNLIGFEWKYPNLFKIKAKTVNLKIKIRIIEPNSIVSKTVDYGEEIVEDSNTVLFILKSGDSQQFSNKLAKIFQFLQL